MSAKTHNDTMTHAFRDGLPCSLFDCRSEPDEKVATGFSSFRDTMIDVACQIEDLFFDEVYECGRTPTLAEITPLAHRLISLTTGATGVAANVRQSLINWLGAPRQDGRAWNIKSSAKQLAEMVQKFPELDKPIDDDGLPF